MGKKKDFKIESNKKRNVKLKVDKKIGKKKTI